MLTFTDAHGRLALVADGTLIPLGEARAGRWTAEALQRRHAALCGCSADDLRGMGGLLPGEAVAPAHRLVAAMREDLQSADPGRPLPWYGRC